MMCSYGEILSAGQGRAPPVPDKTDLFVMLKSEMKTRHTQSLRKFDKRDEDRRDSFSRVEYMPSAGPSSHSSSSSLTSSVPLPRPTARPSPLKP